MLNRHEQNLSSGKRKILVADDELINREILNAYLCSNYEVLQAENGVEVLEIMRANHDTLSLVLLDLLMPEMSGTDVLKAVRTDDVLRHIPIIVITSEQTAEVESLQLGAIDFIPKPYPAIDIIMARVQRTIELSEDRDTIQSTERDTLTGLYNRSYFYHYAAQFDQHYKEKDTDAVILDVNHFHMLNERYGKEYGDEVLRRIAEIARGLVHDSGGIVCRREADTFMVYCPHRDDYQELLDTISAGLATEDDSGSNRVRLRMGVYSNTDKTIDIERRFDRAKTASDSVRGNFAKPVGYYDNYLHEQSIYAEQLIEDFPSAIEQHQFQIYYQPKFDVRPNTPILAGAEALVRWVHPKLGMISPGKFIPLFEENGLIQKLDRYVWQESVKQIRLWRDRFGYSVPVSVNVSRIDMFDPNLAETLLTIVSEHGLSCEDLHLEVTESAYTEDSGQIIRTVNRLRKLGFQIEMDDFGSGYSSLNMISSLPIDVLKLDMHFIREAFKIGGSTHMLDIIIDIAKYLSVPVIAEGVETEEQLDALKALGCELVQGYFFSKPVPAYEFEPFILQKKEMEKAEASEHLSELAAHELFAVPTDVPLSESDEILEAAPSESQESSPATAERTQRSGIQLRTANFCFTVLAFLAAAALFITGIAVTRAYRHLEIANDNFDSAQHAAANMETGSDYLTDCVRCFVVTGDIDYLNDFFEEVNVTRRRDLAVENLQSLFRGGDRTALDRLNAALELSNQLVDIEYLALKMRVEAGSYDPAGIPEELADIELSAADRALSSEELTKKALNLVFDDDYKTAKDSIRENVSLCTEALLRSSSRELENSSARMVRLVRLQEGLTIFFLLIVLGIVIVISTQVRKPLTKMVALMRAQETIPPTGAEELRFVTRTYNTILEENREAREKLSHEASHDALTGLFNRGAYDLLMKSVDTAHMALLIIDVDYFKTVNDTYGHAVGDRVLKRVAEILQHSFRSVDIICRIGGDEFVVVMTRVNSSMGQLVLNKIRHANDLLQHPKDDLPPVTLSVGVAFSDRENPQGDIFTDADTALYQVKQAGRNGCKIFE